MPISLRAAPALVAFSVLGTAALLGSPTAGQDGTAADQAALKGVMVPCNAALNGGNSAATLPLNTEGGILMPFYSQSTADKDAVRQAYDEVFQELKFNVAELAQMAPAWADVRTDTAGTTAHASTGKTTSEANQEPFIFEKGAGGQWRIVRSSFSPVNPPGA